MFTPLFLFLFAFVKGANNKNKAGTGLIAITSHTSFLSELVNVVLNSHYSDFLCNSSLVSFVSITTPFYPYSFIPIHIINILDCCSFHMLIATVDIKDFTQ